MKFSYRPLRLYAKPLGIDMVEGLGGQKLLVDGIAKLSTEFEEVKDVSRCHDPGSDVGVGGRCKH